MSDTLFTNIVPKHVLRQKQLTTLERVAKCLESAYGPFASTTAIRRGENKEEAGHTIYTKDGHTILKSIQIARPIEATTIQDVIDVTEETVKKVGDGTTSATILSYLIFYMMHNAAIKYGVPETKLVADLQETAKKVIAKIDEAKHEATDLDIFEIAMIATNGNTEISDAIRQIYIKHGMGVHIDIGISNTENHVLKEYDGMTFDEGYYNAAFINNQPYATSEIPGPKVYVFEDSFDTVETRTLMDKILADNIYNPIQQMAAIRQMPPEQQKQIEESGKMPEVVPTVIFSTGYGTDMRTSSDEMIDLFARFPIAQRPPVLSVTNIHDVQALADLCTLTGAKPIKKYNDRATQKMDQESNLAPTPDTIHQFAGMAGSVIADATKTKVIDPALMYEKDEAGNLVADVDGNPVYSQVYNSLVGTCEAELKNMLEAKTDITDIYRMRKRINSLKGNMVEYLIGGVAMADRDAVRDLAEDAILNCRSAAQDGVGFGANFEAFRALHAMVRDEELNLPAEVQAALKTEDMKESELGYSMVRILFNAYMELAKILYSSAVGGNMQTAEYIALRAILSNCPCNLREITIDKDGNPVLEKAYDGRVLSSIKSDQVILNAISKIIGLTFATNQFLTQTPAQNVYEEEIYNASTKDPRVSVE